MPLIYGCSNLCTWTEYIKINEIIFYIYNSHIKCKNINDYWQILSAIIKKILYIKNNGELSLLIEVNLKIEIIKKGSQANNYWE